MFRNKPQKELGLLPWYMCSFLFCKLIPEVKTQNTKAKFASSMKEDFQLNESERLEAKLQNAAQKSQKPENEFFEKESASSIHEDFNLNLACLESSKHLISTIFKLCRFCAGCLPPMNSFVWE
jgi:hypothetical protein